MKIIRGFSLLFLFCLTVVTVSAQKQFVLDAPNGKLKTTITVDKTNITYSVSHNGDIMIAESPLSMTLTDGTSFGVNPKLFKSSQTSVNNIIDAPVYKRSKILDNYNELTLQFRGNYNIIFRMYNEGMAYRFVSTSKKPFEVKTEEVVFNFPSNSKAYVPYVREQEKFEDQFFNSFENTYKYISLSEWDKNRLAFAPILIEGANGKKVCITEADLMDYPGMYLYNGNASQTLTGIFASYPKDIKQGGHNELQGLVQSREPYIAKYDKGTSFPWRVVIVSENDAQLADNDMIYKLATPTVDMDFSWVKPGKVAWDWWNAWNLYGVDFKTGVNNDTYKYYIDFAADHGIEYVILDEGWAVNKQADLMQVVPEIDLKELVSYADRRRVGLVLWAGYLAFDRDLENVCRHYSEMGIKGFKVDFMDRDDQPMVDFHRRGAEMAAKYKLMIDYHGTYKPTGLHRTYPNVVNYEGVFGLEQMKWSKESVDMVTYDVTVPFIRMVAGPMDYTQGAMRNASKGNYRPVSSEAMSQGTRCRQLAEYVVFESPFNMLCDSPSNYLREPECTEFIASVPTTWDNTLSLNGEVGKYVTIARQKGDVWYIGSLTNWDARELELDLAFLGEGDFKAEVFRDGVNADRAGRDYVKETIDLSIYKKIKINMAPGGGYVMKITRK
jgi:alpha-glucosidase